VARSPARRYCRTARHRERGSIRAIRARQLDATVNYGDGSGSQTLSLSGKSFSLSHTYATPGSYTVTVAVSDGTASGSQSASAEGQDVRQAAGHRSLLQASTHSSEASNAAIQQLENGNTTPAVEPAERPANEVEAMRVAPDVVAGCAANHGGGHQLAASIAH